MANRSVKRNVFWAYQKKNQYLVDYLENYFIKDYLSLNLSVLC